MVYRWVGWIDWMQMQKRLGGTWMGWVWMDGVVEVGGGPGRSIDR